MNKMEIEYKESAEIPIELAIELYKRYEWHQHNLPLHLS